MKKRPLGEFTAVDKVDAVQTAEQSAPVNVLVRPLSCFHCVYGKHASEEATGACLQEDLSVGYLAQRLGLASDRRHQVGLNECGR